MTKLKPPIFIVGCSHSGTSLMRAILGTHSQIYEIPQETKAAMTRIRINEGTLQEFDRLTLEANKERWVEKTANHIFYIDIIFNSCPNAKVIIMIRDGRDVVASLKAREGKIRIGIEKWVKTSSVVLQYQEYSNVLIVKYENLITEFEKTMRNILDFLGEQYEDGIKNFYERYPQDIEKPPDEDDSHHRQLRAWQLSQPLFDGRDRYKKLELGEIEHITKVGRKMLIRLGYIAREP